MPMSGRHCSSWPMAAGGHWPNRARVAAVALVSEGKAEAARALACGCFPTSARCSRMRTRCLPTTSWPSCMLSMTPPGENSRASPSTTWILKTAQTLRHQTQTRAHRRWRWRRSTRIPAGRSIRRVEALPHSASRKYRYTRYSRYAKRPMRLKPVPFEGRQAIIGRYISPQPLHPSRGKARTQRA